MSKSDFIIPFDRLPERFAEQIEHPPEQPAPTRPAATIVLLRDGTDGLEVLLMRRNRNAGFVPGAYVFPGGRVDGTDATTDVLARLDGLSPEVAEERLALRGAEPPAIAYYLAALREAFEETGILIGRREGGDPLATAALSDVVNQVRDDVMEDRIGFGEALDRLGCRVDGRSVEYLAHWITPLAEPRRYDTRFFAAHVTGGSEPIVDPREMTDAVWITPGGALRRYDQGSLPMVFPTIKTLEQLAGHPDASTALQRIGEAPVRTILPSLVITPTGVGLELDEEG
jgi:8-oxo-dGTP pyrophosphatase MutT (NUDIX family)